MRRRTYLATATGATAVTMAGCIGFWGSDTEENADDETTDDGPPELEGPDDDGTLDDFGNLGAWTVISGAMSAEEEQAVAGDQSVLLEAGTDDQEARIVRELPDSVDCSTVNFGLAVASEDTITPMIQLFDDEDNVIDFRATIHRGRLQRCNFGVTRMDSGIDLTEITDIHIAFLSGEESEDELLFDDLYAVPRAEDGQVMLHFDGGHESIESEALPILEEYDYPATVFVPTDLVREDDDAEGDYLTEDQVEELDDAGCTIASYAANGQILDNYDADDQADQLTEAQEWLEDEGYDDGAGYFSYPAGQYDEDSLELVADTYDIGFAGHDPVQGHVVNAARYPRLLDPEVEDVEAHLERTAKLGGITTLCYYSLEEEESIERLEETMELLDDHVDDGNLEVVMPEDLETEYVFDGE
ncbi:polysaccharide deacetylase family protein [Natronorubrum sp. FCH18a]|uniref:polysaccharide deacetylase family protein n=1 Tax=Natronorubrum sp. FCH18a TaxID=3447018 RepID=UPI003F516361